MTEFKRNPSKKRERTDNAKQEPAYNISPETGSTDSYKKRKKISATSETNSTKKFQDYLKLQNKIDEAGKQWFSKFEQEALLNKKLTSPPSDASREEREAQEQKTIDLMRKKSFSILLGMPLVSPSVERTKIPDIQRADSLRNIQRSLETCINHGDIESLEQLLFFSRAQPLTPKECEEYFKISLKKTDIKKTAKQKAVTVEVPGFFYMVCFATQPDSADSSTSLAEKISLAEAKLRIRDFIPRMLNEFPFMVKHSVFTTGYFPAYKSNVDITVVPAFNGNLRILEILHQQHLITEDNFANIQGAAQRSGHTRILDYLAKIAPARHVEEETASTPPFESVVLSQETDSSSTASLAAASLSHMFQQHQDSSPSTTLEINSELSSTLTTTGNTL